MSSSYYVTYGTDRLTFPGATGSVAWEYKEPLPTFSIEFGEGNMYSAGLTAEYNGKTVYSSPVGTAIRTASGIPSGAKITFCGSSPKYHCFVASSFTGLSGTSTVYNGSSRDGVGTTSTAYITSDATAKLSDGHQKTIRVQGDFPSVPGEYRYATIYCRVTSMSSWMGTSLVNGSAWLRSNMTGMYKCLKSDSWGAGNSTTVTTWLGRNCSAHTWSGYCDTTGNPYYKCSGYLERAAGFVTFGKSAAGYDKVNAYGSVSNQTGGYFARGCMTTYAGRDCAKAVNGRFWVTAYAP